MTKADIAKEVQKALAIRAEEAGNAVEVVLKTIKGRLAEGEAVKIPGFGVFSVRKKPPRKGRDMTRGIEVPLEAKRVVTFRASLKLKNHFL